MARAMARPPGRISLSAFPWITTVGNDSLCRQKLPLPRIAAKWR
jgi:hypothetical protein